jgi:hypothetical protein
LLRAQPSARTAHETPFSSQSIGALAAAQQWLLYRHTIQFSKTTMTIRTAGTVQSWFEQHEGELQHLPWPVQSPDLKITEPLWSVSETRVRNKFPSPTSLKQREDVLQELWYKIPL